MTDHQADERERQSNQPQGLRALGPDVRYTVYAVYIRNIRQALPVVGQLGGRLCLSPQRLHGNKALEVKRLFPREHVVHGARQLVPEYRQGFGFAVLVFQFREIFLAGLIVP